MVIIYVRIIYFSCHKNDELLTHIVQKSHPRLNIVFIIDFLWIYNLILDKYEYFYLIIF
jgi:hypothetical protein